MKRLLREPLLHFLVLGAAIFTVHGLVAGRRAPEGGRIVVTQARIEALATGFARTWQRLPSPQELEDLIRDHVREEAATREAIALGLDRDDIVIRRRLRQKLEFVLEDDVAEPSEQELRAWFESHAADFRQEPRITFSHVYLDADRRGPALATDASVILARLRAEPGRDPAHLGDPFLLGHRFERQPVADVRQQFGEAFGTALDRLEPVAWSGPIQSGYGLHLVLVHERIEGRLPTFEAVRNEVHRDWSQARRAAAEERLYRSLLERYRVTIEAPARDTGAVQAASGP